MPYGYIDERMMDYLQHIDQTWLVAVNGWHSPWADTLMWIVSGKLTWLPLYALLAGLIIWRYRRPVAGAKMRPWVNILLIFAAFGVAVGLSDYISSGIIKHCVCRLRPTHEPLLEGVLHIVNDYRGGQYGFVSSHAANTMACALLFSLVWRNWKATLPLMLWVAVNCYSRMYLGVHYPGDILGGLIVGSVMAVLAYWLLSVAKVPFRRRDDGDDGE
ncbi:MAG: phosphatase PAP2 family protein [Paludibacteraceae bacterium]|nr:phosphatase PAP2 family protein [Paludibacteraceae bacterium]